MSRFFRKKTSGGRTYLIEVVETPVRVLSPEEAKLPSWVFRKMMGTYAKGNEIVKAPFKVLHDATDGRVTQ
jgi:hypothetical protein